MEQTYMKEQPILNLLLKMSLPMVVSMLVNSLYNIVDSFFVAKISENAMTALSLVFPVQNLINAVMIGFGIGINAVISFLSGSSRSEKSRSGGKSGNAPWNISWYSLMIICLVVIHPFPQSLYQRCRNCQFRASLFKKSYFYFLYFFCMGTGF